jgi:hypothetical protein
MARLNATKREKVTQRLTEETTTNYEGAVAFKLDARDKLVEQVVGAFWNEDLFYAKGKKISKEIVENIKTVAKIDPRFPLQLAAYARNVLYLRTTPQVILVEAARIPECKPFVVEYTPKIVKRADELSEIVAYYSNNYGKDPKRPNVTHANFPNSLKKGLAKAFLNFDEYQLNKYDSSKADVSLGQVAQLVHPAIGKALYNYLTKDEVDVEALPKTAALKALLAKDSLDAEAIELIKKSGVTWETLISKFGSTKENWELVAPNMGYMALLRNLRNFQEKGVDLDPILARITDENEIKRSKQLPFRFLSAYREISDQKISRAIAQAFEKSISNVRLDGKTAILVDLSGSMDSKLSAKSKVSYKDTACTLAAIAAKKSADSIVIGFGDRAKTARINPDDTMMTNIEQIKGLGVGFSTNAWLAFEELGTKEVDRVILISDMQCYDSQHRDNYYAGYGWGYNGSQVRDVHKMWATYAKKYPNAKLFSLDINAYGTKQTPSNAKNVVLLNGWSDKIFDLIAIYEKGNAMVEEIKNW